MSKRSRQEWKALMEQHAESGQTLREFCNEHKLKRATFIWWRKEFRRADRKAKEGEARAPLSPSKAEPVQAPLEPLAATPKKARRTRGEWKQIITHWMDSGETAVAYAEAHNLKVNTLRWWKSELFGKARKGARSSPRRRSAPTRASRGPVKRMEPLTEPLVDLLATQPTMRAADVARRLNASYQRVLRELRELEELGIVFRTGKGPGARWVLG